VDVKLDWLTVLIGANNSGKTSFLEAMNAAIGSVRHAINIEDIFVGSDEKTPPKDRNVIIDLLIKPTHKDGKVSDHFPQGSPWLELWGNGIALDDDANEFVGIRTIAKWNSTRGEYVTERKFLGEWLDDDREIDKVKLLEKSGNVTPKHLEPLLLYFMDAKRDILDEMRNRASFWYKLVSDPGISNEKITKIERILNKLNEQIISNSEVLEHVQSHLDELYKTIQADRGGVSITPLTRSIRDLSKGMDVNFSTSGAQSFSLTRHGMGTRSLASIFTFKAYSSWRQKQLKGFVHSLLAMEEPEAHLHPQAQRAIYSQIKEVVGQRLISTHSPYLASQAEICQFRHFQKTDSETHVTQYDTSQLDREDIRKINRMVMNTRGELLFARGIILFEGETEEQALPIYAEKYFDNMPISMGLTFVGVGGDGGYAPFLRMAAAFNIPWYIFSDGEKAAQNNVAMCLKKIGLQLPLDNVFVIPDNKHFEEYIVSEGYIEPIRDAIILLHAHNKQHHKALVKEWNARDDLPKALIEELNRHKTRYAAPVAERIVALDEDDRFPELIKSMLGKISEDLKIT